MVWSLLARGLLIVVITWAAVATQPVPGGRAVNVALGAGVSALVILAERALRGVSALGLLGGLLGAGIGLAMARGFDALFWWVDHNDPRVAFLHGAVLVVLVYLGLVVGVQKGEWLTPSRLIGLFRAPGAERRYKVLDTSVIIDGRIADVCEAGFIEGTLVVPQFVLKELQFVADSSDSLKRNRGRRGLDILQKMQKMSGVDVLVSDLDFPEVREVDLKLIEVARHLHGHIVTNDFNLNKVASLRGIGVLNVNELANALKPVVLPGEFMKVLVLKEGKEYNQGVAYLDDGTMVVVDNARKLIGKTIDIVVSSVLQTTAGKMIFGRHIEPGTAAQPQTTQGPGQPAGNPVADRDDTSRKPRPVPQL